MRARGCSEPPFEGIDRCPGNATEVEDCKTSDCTGDIFFLWNPPGIVLVESLLIIPTTVATKGGKEGFVIS